MPAIELNFLGQPVRLACGADEKRRLEDLAAALNQRLAGFGGDADPLRGLALTALALLDETQAQGAALARARAEIERLNDLVVDARAAGPLDEGRGRVVALRRAGAA